MLAAGLNPALFSSSVSVHARLGKRRLLANNVAAFGVLLAARHVRAGSSREQV